jgi:hypothetical protein
MRSRMVSADLVEDLGEVAAGAAGDVDGHHHEREVVAADALVQAGWSAS